MPFYIVYQTENTRNNGHNFGGGGGGGVGRGEGTRREVLISLQVVRPISPSRKELMSTKRRPSQVEYQSGGTGSPHPGVGIFPKLQR